MPSKFQIVIDCETDFGAFYFCDALGLTQEILASVAAEAEAALIMGCREGKPINMTSAAIVKPARVEMRATVLASAQ